MTARATTITGWTFAIITALLFTLTGLLKFMPIEPGTEMEAMMIRLGTLEIEPALGVLQLIIAALFIIPRTSTVGLVLMVGYIGGALATNITHGFTAMEAMPCYIFFVLIMLTAWFRNPELTARLRGKL